MPDEKHFLRESRDFGSLIVVHARLKHYVVAQHEGREWAGVALDFCTIGGCRLLIVFAHLPHEKRDIEAFCTELDCIGVFISSELRRGNTKVILAADANVELPEYLCDTYPTVGSLFSCDKRNDRSICFLELLVRYALVALNTCLELCVHELGADCEHHDLSTAWTWCRKNRYGHVNTRIVDYICSDVSGSFKIDYSADCKSDHRLIWGRFRGHDSYKKGPANESKKHLTNFVEASRGGDRDLRKMLRNLGT
jgi:hypothetical protein